jgi:hypothetical protein
MSVSLYSIAADYAAAMNRLLESGLPDEVIKDTLDGMDGEVVAKARNVVAYMLNLEAEAAMIREAEIKMAERRGKIEKSAARFREYLKENMEKCKITEISAIDGSFVAKLLIDRDESVVIDDDLLLDPEFLTVTTTATPRKADIKRAIKAGRDVAGARIQKSSRLEIK